MKGIYCTPVTAQARESACVLRMKYLSVGATSAAAICTLRRADVTEMRNTSIQATNRGVRNTPRPHLPTRDMRGGSGSVPSGWR